MVVYKKEKSSISQGTTNMSLILTQVGLGDNNRLVELRNLSMFINANYSTWLISNN